VRCAANAENSMVTSVRGVLSPTDHQISQETRIAHYKSGTERYPNPERPSAESAYYNAKSAFDSVEPQYKQAQAACNSNHSKSSCDQYSALSTIYNGRQSELQSKQQHLNNTPQTLERDVFTDLPYTVRHHSFNTPYLINFLFGGDAAALQTDGAFRDQDSEHQAVPQASIPADPLISPSREQMQTAFFGKLIEPLQATYAQRIAIRAKCGQEAWNMDSPTLECRALSAFYLAPTLPDPATWVGVSCK
jgi:hypothetical protein